jgi:hypothetical protein
VPTGVGGLQNFAPASPLKLGDDRSGGGSCASRAAKTQSSAASSSPKAAPLDRTWPAQ